MPAEDDMLAEITRDLVEEVLRTALVLEDVIKTLLDKLPEDAFPDKDNGEALLQMVVGSVEPATFAAGERDCRTTIALVGSIRERVLADLHAAAILARRRRG